MDQTQSKVRSERSRFGLPLKRFSISLLVLTLVLCTASFAAEIPTPTPGIVKWLPASNEIKGWEVYPDTLVYVEGQDLTEVYNGDVDTYTKAGVQAAAQQMYRSGKQTVTATIHKMDSMVNTKKFYKKFEVDDKKQSTYKKLALLSEGYVYSANGAANGYLFRNKYYITVQVNVDGQHGRAIAFDFLKNVSKGYWKLAGR